MGPLRGPTAPIPDVSAQRGLGGDPSVDQSCRKPAAVAPGEDAAGVCAGGMETPNRPAVFVELQRLSGTAPGSATPSLLAE